MNLTLDQIEMVVTWMNQWDQLKDTAIPLRFRSDFSKHVSSRPPLGLIPKWLHDDHRKSEIIAAMLRYGMAGMPTPTAWIEEYRQLSAEHQKPDTE